jgi:hypothetical protein
MDPGTIYGHTEAALAALDVALRRIEELSGVARAEVRGRALHEQAEFGYPVRYPVDRCGCGQDGHCDAQNPAEPAESCALPPGHEGPHGFEHGEDTPIVYDLPPEPVTERRLEDCDGAIWVRLSDGDYRLTEVGTSDFDPGTVGWRLPWVRLLVERRPLKLLPLTEREQAQAVLYGPPGARWGSPNTPCPYMHHYPADEGQASVTVLCALGRGHIGPHLDKEGDALPFTPAPEPTGAEEAAAREVICTCGNPAEHQPGCPRYERVSGDGEHVDG